MKPGEFQIVYIGLVNTDSCEGKGRDHLYGDYVFTSRKAAQDSVKGKDVMGSNGHVVESRVIYGEDGKFYLLSEMYGGGKQIKVSDVSLQEIEAQRLEVASNALKKLTPKEIEALGLKQK